MMQPGFVALSARPGSDAPDLSTLLDPLIGSSVRIDRQGDVVVASWGLDVALQAGLPLSLVGTVRTRTTDLRPEQVASRIAGAGVADILPPYGVIWPDRDGLAMTADPMGFRQLYLGGSAELAGLSTSASLLARCLNRELDPEAVAVQALLGWQLGQRTMFTDVAKLAPGAVARLAGGRVSSGPEPAAAYVEPGDASRSAPLELDEAVRCSAALLRDSLTAYLTERPGAVLQLTGGQDSRLLLSAIPPDLRKGLGVMTLGDRGDPDVEVAGLIAERYGLVHEVHGMAGLERLEPADAWQRCRDAAQRLDMMADPLAFAALAWAEARFRPAPRLSGLGGEVARGFYYYGLAGSWPVTRARAARLADWRMLANEAVEPAAQAEWFADWSRSLARAEVLAALQASGRSWFESTDDLYLRHRMQRWAGVTDTAWSFEREIVNPMLDPEFLTIAARLAPADKRGSQFLARLQMALDPELGQVPLDGRPAPEAYTRRSLSGLVAQGTSQGRRVGRKVRQRMAGKHRPPAGGTVLGRLVVQHWRAEPRLLDPVRSLGLLDGRWVDSVLDRRIEPEPGSVALVTNLVAATELVGKVALLTVEPRVAAGPA